MDLYVESNLEAKINEALILNDNNIHDFTMVLHDKILTQNPFGS